MTVKTSIILIVNHDLVLGLESNGIMLHTMKLCTTYVQLSTKHYTL